MLFSALLFSAVAATPAASKTARWEITADPMLCYLHSINRGPDEQDFVVEVEPLGQEISLVLVEASDLPKKEATAVLRSASSGESIQAKFYPSSQSRLFDNSVRVSAGQIKFLQNTKNVEVLVAGKTRHKISLEGFTKGLAAIDNCTSDILKRIGYIPNQPTPTPPGGFVEKVPREWINNDDFSHGPVRDGGGGKALIGWIVGRDGRVRNCTTLAFEGNARLGVESCKLLTRRAKYNPRTDASGSAIEEFSYRWMVYRP